MLSSCTDPNGSSPRSPPSLKFQYVIARSDLSRGVLAAQVGHAASEAAGHPPTVMIVLAVDGEAELRRVAAALGDHGLPHHLVVEEDGPYTGQAMTIGVEPSHDRAAIKKVLSSLPLIK